MRKGVTMRRLLVGALLACTPYGYGCGTVTILRPTTSLDESALSRGVASGTSTVQGQAFLKTVGGDVKFAAGNVIYLCPLVVGEYLIEAARLRKEEDPPGPSGRGTLVEYDQRAEKACRSMKGDGQGHFHFTDVAAGDYTLATWIVWGVYTGSTTMGVVISHLAASWTSVSTGATGGLTTATVTVQAGETADVIVNDIAVWTQK